MIIAAAIKERDGEVYALPAPARHHDIISYMVNVAGLPKPIRGEQGFIDHKIGFVNLTQAKDIALNVSKQTSLAKLVNVHM